MVSNACLEMRIGLVAVAGGHGNLVPALGAAAAQNGGTGLGLHAGKEAVHLAPAAAIGLKGTLWHGVVLCVELPLPQRLAVRLLLAAAG